MKTEKEIELSRKIEIIKGILERLTKGEDINKLKTEFKNILSSIKPWEIPLIEQELVKTGISPREIARVCELHVELFRESLISVKDLENLPAGHPLDTFIRENLEILKDVEKLNLLIQNLDITQRNFNDILSEIDNLIRQLYFIKKHFMRLQLQVFPYLERIGLFAVPRVLWRKQDEIMILLKKVKLAFKKLVESDNKQSYLKELKKVTTDFIRAVTEEIFRENNILFPTTKVLFPEGVWVAIREEESLIGFYKITPNGEWRPTTSPIYPYQFRLDITQKMIEDLPKEIIELLSKAKQDVTPLAKEGDIEFENGYLSIEEIKEIFNALPIDITFIDKDDRTKFFSHGKERIFVRTKAVLGRPVEFCHPPRSVHIVKKILNAFKKGERDYADFWINFGGRLIYIKYVPVKNRKGDYIGTLEIVQDITDLKKIEGEKRILDWR